MKTQASLGIVYSVSLRKTEETGQAEDKRGSARLKKRYLKVTVLKNRKTIKRPARRPERCICHSS